MGEEQSNGWLHAARGMVAAAVLALAGLGLLGCNLTPTEGVMACDDEGDCPSGWFCLNDGAGRHCYATAGGCTPGVWDESHWDEGCWQ
jgi:hypothetical protein